jgi:hypothetical protein
LINFLDHTLDQREENSKKLEEEERAEDMLHKEIYFDIDDIDNSIDIFIFILESLI